MSVKPTRGIVSSPHPTASEVGRRVLNSGGTAVDAAIAVAFTLTVVAPSCTGIAGYGGSALIYHAGDRTVHTVDFTSRAPGAASAAMFSVRENANGRFSVAHGANAKGPLAVDIPGVLAGLALIQRRYGTLPLRAVVQPAVEVATVGYPVDALTVQTIHEMLVPNATEFPVILRAFSINGRVPEVGERLTNPQLASVLDRIGRNGPEAFYQGQIAQAIVDTVQRGGGLLTLEDLASYEAVEPAPVRCTYRGLTAYAGPLPVWTHRTADVTGIGADGCSQH